MKREQFIKDAEARAVGHFQKWAKNPEFREAIAKPNPARKVRQSSARKRTPA